jgi:hypothetical protein
MTTTTRQNNLILAEDWTRIYQTFKNADFKSYDFENLRRVILTYLRENYPEDFNDYIESSEYLALIDAVAFLGQSLAFRIDLASRENFIELAERKESVLRIARMLAYNAKRNISAFGQLKFDTVTTTDTIFDSNGKNLANQVIVWNDPTNPNWLEQFTLVLNSAMVPNVEIGRSQGNNTIQGFNTDQYRFNTASSDIPLFSFSKVVAGRNMTFEIVSTTFKDSEEIYEESPIPGNQMGFIFKQDGRGAGSANTGFFMLFKQGSLEVADFAVDVPTTNEKVSVDSDGINNNDVWLYNIGPNGEQLDQWTQTSALIGNNIVYNSITNGIRNIYSVITKENDRIDLLFSDGVYGNLPQGNLRVYYRVSNGLSYSIAPPEMRGINVNIPYLNKQGVLNNLTVGLSLKYTVNNASETESLESIRTKAPLTYYTQNRMITGEDYNLAPLSSSQDILKIKAINRTSSGISRNFDIIDASGRYSKINVFADDGLLYKTESEKTLSFKFTNRIDIINFIKNRIEPIFTEFELYNFYLGKFDKILFTDDNSSWVQITKDINNSTGYFINFDDTLIRVGAAYTTSGLRYLEPGALIRFDPPTGKAFLNNEIVDANPNDSRQRDRLWTRAIRVIGDGTNANKGVLSSGLGPIVFSDVVPTGAVVRRIVPKFLNNLPDGIENELVNIISNNLNFGLRYSIDERSWKIILGSNLDVVNPFSLGKQGDFTNNNLDASWLLSFTREATEYVVKIRILEYVFESIEQNRFYFDKNTKVYDAKSGLVTKDAVNVLGVNTKFNGISSLNQDFVFEVSDSVRLDDGYQNTAAIKVKFSDKDSDGVIDNPEEFEQIIGLDSDLNFLFFQETADAFGSKIFKFIQNDIVPETGKLFVEIEQRETLININDYVDGQLIYFYDIGEDRVKRVNRSTNTFDIESSYRANVGRANLKFQYTHNANIDRRIDPSVSNIIDIFILPKNYDTEYRKFLSGGTSSPPEVPTSDALRTTYGAPLNLIKSVSDEIIYHPVEYKVLFGATANSTLQAQFKVVKNPAKNINDNDLKVRIISAINDFFNISNWDFGDKFYISELTTFVINQVSPDISNMIIVPRQPTQTFGSLFEVQSRADEIFVSGATVDDVEIVSSITAAEIRVSIDQIVTSTTR